MPPTSLEKKPLPLRFLSGSSNSTKGTTAATSKLVCRFFIQETEAWKPYLTLGKIKMSLF